MSERVSYNAGNNWSVTEQVHILWRICISHNQEDSVIFTIDVNRALVLFVY